MRRAWLRIPAIRNTSSPPGSRTMPMGSSRQPPTTADHEAKATGMVGSPSATVASTTGTALTLAADSNSTPAPGSTYSVSDLHLLGASAQPTDLDVGAGAHVAVDPSKAGSAYVSWL